MGYVRSIMEKHSFTNRKIIGGNKMLKANMLYNTDRPTETEGQLHYNNIAYDTKERFCSYWHQINEIVSLNPEKVLEVGIGNGFVSDYLRNKDTNIFTLDINSRLKPNIVGSVMALPFTNQSFKVITCFEVLEHLPYDNFPGSLAEIYRVSNKYVILSLPDHTAVYRFHIELPRIKPIKKLIPHPFPRPIHHEFDGEHYWIIGKAQYPLTKIERDIKQIGFKIIKTYRVFEFYGHRFFLLIKL